jgi:hypothetical protein
MPSTIDRALRDLEDRFSRFGSRRRRAHDACLWLIEWRETDLGLRPPLSPFPDPQMQTIKT